MKRLVVKGILWIEEVIDKLATKHGVKQQEVEEIFENEPYVRFVEKGHRPGKNVYAAFGETNAGDIWWFFTSIRVTSGHLLSQRVI